MKLRLSTALFLAFTAAALAIGACSSTVDEVTNSIDCHGVCKRYADCFNADYDVDGCTDKCENNADASDERQRKLNMCDTCIDDRSCKAATFNCADDCVGIVP
jgi:hypothetical protein